MSFSLDQGSKKLTIVEPPRKLIISSGDTSDVDGFMALAEYSKVDCWTDLALLMYVCDSATF